MNIKGKVIVITGSTKGLGKALAQQFIAAGASVIITGRSKDSVERVAREIGATPMVLDVTDEEQVKAVSWSAVKQFGRIDVWVNNAGVWLPKAAITELNMQRVHDMINVNLFGTMHGSRVALEQMRAQGQGMIINILSTSALTGRAYSSGYSASKYAAVGFTNSLRLEVQDANENILVIGAYPGGMKTNLFDESKPGDYDSYMNPNEVAQKILENIQLDHPAVEQVIKRQL